MATQPPTAMPQPEHGLSAGDLADYRDVIEKQRDRARAIAAGPLGANQICQREYNKALDAAYTFALDLLDELLADAVTFALAEPGDSQIGD